MFNEYKKISADYKKRLMKLQKNFKKGEANKNHNCDTLCATEFQFATYRKDPWVNALDLETDGESDGSKSSGEADDESEDIGKGKASSTLIIV